jgi:hypothetical protein
MLELSQGAVESERGYVVTFVHPDNEAGHTAWSHRRRHAMSPARHGEWQPVIPHAPSASEAMVETPRAARGCVARSSERFPKTGSPAASCGIG